MTERTDLMPENMAAGRPESERLRSMSTIGDMARLYGLTLRALRFYEDRGLIAPLRHGTTRFYDATARSRVETILRGKHLGFTLAQIRAMLARNASGGSAALDIAPGEMEAQILRLERKRDDLDDAITELRRTHCDMQSHPAEAGVA
jgi:DNA-binding transcriptional MerR regulator